MDDIVTIENIITFNGKSSKVEKVLLMVII